MKELPENKRLEEGLSLEPEDRAPENGDAEIEALLMRVRQANEQIEGNAAQKPEEPDSEDKPEEAAEEPKETQADASDDAFLGSGSNEPEAEEAIPESESEPELKITRKKEPFVVHFDEDKSYKKIRNYHKVKQRKQHKALRFFLHLFLALCILAAALWLGYVVLEGITDILGINQEDNEIIVEIPEGATLTDISQILEDDGVITSAKLFHAFDQYADVTGEYQFGTFVLNTKMSYEEIMIELKQYQIVKETVRVTFPEGSTLFDISKKLEEAGVCDADEFLDAINQTNFTYSYMSEISDNEMKYFKMEGFAFPDTYDFYLKDNPVSVAQKFLNNLDKRVTSSMRERMEELGISFEDTIILASIVQAEAITEEQMQNVASVYWNRLNHPTEFPKLQADPTRVYGRAMKADMQIINQEQIDAYDTYTSDGLPPGAICNPGLDAINAVLYPAETDYYYFCSNLETGECFYAQTLEEHEQNLHACGLQ